MESSQNENEILIDVENEFFSNEWNMHDENLMKIFKQKKV
jgi:hypothetical protein